MAIHRHNDGLVLVRFSTTSLESDHGVIILQSPPEQKTREDELGRSHDLLERTQRISRVGSQELDLVTDTPAWTDQTKHIRKVPLDYEPTVDDAIEFYVTGDWDRIRELLDRRRSEGVPWGEEF